MYSDISQSVQLGMAAETDPADRAKRPRPMLSFAGGLKVFGVQGEGHLSGFGLFAIIAIFMLACLQMSRIVKFPAPLERLLFLDARPPVRFLAHVPSP